METQKILQELAIKYPGMCKIGDEKIWSSGMMERFTVVLAHLRRVQDGTRWIQCIRSMGEPEIEKLREMVAMIPPDDLKPKKPTQEVQPGEDMDDEEQPEEPDDSQPADSDSGDSGPTKYKPDSDSGDSGTEVPLVPTTKDKIKKKWNIMKKPAASKTPGKSTVKSNKVKTKEAGEKGNFKTVGNKRFKMTLASHQSDIQFQELGQQKWSLWVACSQSQCSEHHEVIKKTFQEMPSSKEKAVQPRDFLI